MKTISSSFWRKLNPSIALIALSWFTTAAAIPIAINFSSNVNASAKSAFTYAANLWGQAIPAAFQNETLSIDVSFSSLGGLTLASTTTPEYLVNNNYSSAHPYSNPFFNNYFYPTSLIEHIHGGALFTASDFSVAFDSSRSWFYGTNGTPASGQYDFITIALHEIAHGLGITSFINADGTFLGGHPSIYDKFLCSIPCRSASDLLVNITNAARKSAIVSNNIQWIGGFGNYGSYLDGYSGPLSIYAPASFIDGSSISHLNPTVFPNELMRPAFSTQDVDHTIGNITYGMLEDIGWRKIPEPPTITIMLLGMLILLGMRVNRTRAR